jgi:hypothetical protein
VDIRRFLLIVVVFTVGAVTPLAAAGGGDVFGRVGVVRIDKGVGTYASVGGGVSGMVGDKAALFGEFNYIHFGIASASSADFSASAKAIQAGAGSRLFLPTGSSKVRLYVPIVGGVLRLSASGSFFGSSMSASETGGYFDIGFGSEISLGQKLGVRPEFRHSLYMVAGKEFKPLSVSAEIFYRFGGR